MEEEMMVMIRTTPHQYSTCWTLYDNPSYANPPTESHPTLSARKLAACLWHLTFIMDSELDMARAKIRELKAELEYERKQRKKVETVNKKLCKQILEERKRREAVEDACEKLAREVTSEKAEMDRMKKDIMEERRMLRMSEVLREERVQMKLSEAKNLFEEKLSELEFYKLKATEEWKVSNVTSTNESTTMSPSIGNTNTNTNTNTNSSSTSTSTSNNINVIATVMNKRRGSPEAENPHIKRGIKGFVEFPRVVRAISSRGRQLGSKVECQKAQLQLLLRQKSPFRSNNLIMS